MSDRGTTEGFDLENAARAAHQERRKTIVWATAVAALIFGGLIAWGAFMLASAVSDAADAAENGAKAARASADTLKELQQANRRVGSATTLLLEAIENTAERNQRDLERILDILRACIIAPLEPECVDGVIAEQARLDAENRGGSSSPLFEGPNDREPSDRPRGRDPDPKPTSSPGPSPKPKPSPSPSNTPIVCATVLIVERCIERP